jgi:DNA polymerase-3 subunit epsilon
VRQIVLDTETTGLDPQQGHRVIEVAAVEMIGRRLTSNRFHRYINPERDSDPGALQVHGLTTEFLQDKPKFREVASELLEYLRGAQLIIHNAAFDVGFLNHELSLLGLPPVTECCAEIVDSLKMARELHPGKRNSLDALCERYEIDNSHRTFHGALLDAELLSDVYLAMTRGQESLMIEIEAAEVKNISEFESAAARHALLVLLPTDAELAEHQKQIEEIDKASRGACMWKQLDAENAIEEEPLEAVA